MYESFFGLKEKPFGLTPDPKFFYGSSGHKRVLAYLRYGIKQGEGFIVVTGEVGAGKTTLLGALSEELSGNRDIIAKHLVSTDLGPDDLLRIIAASFELSYETIPKSMLLKNIEMYLRRRASEGKRVVLIVDEVQNMPAHSLEELRMLSNYQVYNKPLLQSFLIGQSEFRRTIRLKQFEQLRQRIIASYHLGPMNVIETRGYIEHRLNCVGWKGNPKFTREAYDAIYDYTAGIPRRINTLCDRVLLAAYLDEKYEIDEQLINDVIGELQDEVAGDGQPDQDEQISALSGAAFGSSAKTKDMTLEQRISRLENIIQRISEAVSGS